MYFGEMNIGIRVWFGRRVRQCLEDVRDWEKNDWGRRQQMADPQVLELMAEWYCEHIADFIKDDPRDTYCVDDVHNDERVKFQRNAVYNTVWDVLDSVTAALERMKEAKRYETLDAWLEALHAGKLSFRGPSEKDGEDLVEDWRPFRSGARKRRVRWPRVCRTCGEEFRIEKGNAKNCSECRRRKRPPKLRLVN